MERTMNRQVFWVTAAVLMLIAVSHTDGHPVTPTLPSLPIRLQDRVDKDTPDRNGPAWHGLSEPTTYGLFVGVHHGEIRGDLDATSLRNTFTFSKNLIKPENQTLLTGDYEEGGIPNSTIERAIKNLKSRMRPRDKLIVYLSAHGFSETQGDESSETPGDEYLVFSRGSRFTDDYLTSLLAGMDEVEKWVMIDACRSGGFWTSKRDGESQDDGDMERLGNISFFAPAGETEESYADKDGRGYFAGAIAKVVESEGLLTFDVLEHSVRQSALWDGLEERPLYLRSLGDIIDLPLDTWSPLAFKSDDFKGTLGHRGVAEPTHAVFLSCGLAGLVVFRRMFGRND
jgi:hypothetical protein